MSDIVISLWGGHVFYLIFPGLTWNYTLRLHEPFSATQDCGVHFLGIHPMQLPVLKISFLEEMYHTETCSSAVGSPLPFMTHDIPNEVSPVTHMRKLVLGKLFCEQQAMDSGKGYSSDKLT